MDKLTTLSKRSLPLRHVRRNDVASQSLLGQTLDLVCPRELYNNFTLLI
nr:MAG TPA: hypothetical protein [Inoviridae sp.]